MRPAGPPSRQATGHPGPIASPPVESLASPRLALVFVVMLAVSGIANTSA
jgi:hypothetical protein